MLQVFRAQTQLSVYKKVLLTTTTSNLTFNKFVDQLVNVSDSCSIFNLFEGLLIRL